MCSEKKIGKKFPIFCSKRSHISFWTYDRTSNYSRFNIVKLDTNRTKASSSLCFFLSSSIEIQPSS